MEHRAVRSSAEALPLYRIVADALRGAITRGLLAPGGRLSETTVAAVLGTSRTPARLALERLAEEGLLARAAGQGYVIGGLADLPGLRLGHEALAGALASLRVRRATASWTTIYDEIEREVAALSPFGPLRLVEARSARDHGVSRTVVHEVFMRLERLGLIEKDASGRWIILAMTPERVREIYAVRGLLEPAAIAWAAARIPEADLRAMRARLASVLERYPEVQMHELDALEHDLHLVCVARCGNAELVKLLRINQTLLVHNKHMLGSHLALPRVDPFLCEHAAILDRLIVRDGAGAAAAMQAHLAAALPIVLERLEHLRAAGPPPTSLVCA